MNRSDEIAESVARGIIPIFDQIDQDKVLMVRRAFGDLYLQRQEKVIVLISSSGGDGTSGRQIYDLLRLYPGEVTGIVVGRAMSAASFVLQGCDKRYATPNSLLLIHNGFQEVGNDILLSKKKTTEFLRENARDRKRIHLILANATKRTVAEIAAECRKNRCLDVEQAVRFGLLDGVWTTPLPWNPAKEEELHPM